MRALRTATLVAAILLCLPHTAVAQEGLGEEQAQEKQELKQMREELGDIKSNISGALDEMQKLGSQQQTSQAPLNEMHLFAKTAACELAPGIIVECDTYNGKLPGPVIRVTEGNMVRIVLHNQLKQSTSLLLHGLPAPHTVSGLPRKGAGMLEPGQGYAYQFMAKQPGTYFYHPQVNNADEKAEGMSGILIVEPRDKEKTFDKEILVVLSDLNAREGGAQSATRYRAVPPGQPGALHFSLMNGKCAPAIAPIELRRGERVRLRVVNAGQQSVPLYLSGHRFEVIAVNGSDALEPHTFRDTVTVNPSDRYDLEFTADNPGVWSLASESYAQTTQDGKFPAGIACVVRYVDQEPETR